MTRPMQIVMVVNENIAELKRLHESSGEVTADMVSQIEYLWELVKKDEMNADRKNLFAAHLNTLLNGIKKIDNQRGKYVDIANSLVQLGQPLGQWKRSQQQADMMAQPL